MVVVVAVVVVWTLGRLGRSDGVCVQAPDPYPYPLPPPPCPLSNLARARGALGCATVQQFDRADEGAVAAVGKRSDDEPHGVAEVLVTVQRLGRCVCQADSKKRVTVWTIASVGSVVNGEMWQADIRKRVKGRNSVQAVFRC